MKHRLLTVIAIALATAPAIAFAGGARRARDVDVNGDGKADLVVSEPEDGGARGRLHVYFGAAGGLAGAPDQTFGGASADPALHVVDLAGLGDVDGDGFGDVLAISDAGASVYLGGAKGLVTSPAAILRTPDGETDGVRFVALGDVNGDGLDDIGAAVDCRPRVEEEGPVIAGAPQPPVAKPAASRVVPCKTTQAHFYAWFGTRHGLPVSPDQAIDVTKDETQMPATLTGVGDVDGDGLADVVRREGGRAQLFLGTSTGLATAPTGKALAPRGVIVVRVAAAGDVDGDGHADVVLIGRSTTLDRSYAFVHRGGAKGLATKVTAKLTVLGAEDGGGVGDLDGDGRGDLALGEIGEVTVRRGTATGVARRSMLVSPLTPAGNFGSADVGSPGDLDGDGRRDLVVAAPFSGGPIDKDNHGLAFVYRGGDLRSAPQRLAGLSGTLGGDFATAIALSPP